MQIFFSIYFFYLGALFASFYNVVGIRIYEHRSINTRSSCPKCEHQLRWLDIIPIFGFLINRGKCHFCQERIHPKYLLIELLGGLLLMLSYLTYGFSLEFLVCFIFLAILMIISVAIYEYNRQMIVLVYFAFPVLIIIEFFIGSLFSCLIGAAISATCFLLISLVFPSIKRYLLLMTFIGFVLGIYAVWVFLALMLLGWGMKFLMDKIRFPFIYYVCIISMFAVLYGQQLMSIIFDFSFFLKGVC